MSDKPFDANNFSRPNDSAKLVFEQPAVSANASQGLPGHKLKDGFRVQKDGTLASDEKAFDPDNFAIGDAAKLKVIYPKNEQPMVGDTVPDRPMARPKAPGERLTLAEYISQLLGDDESAHAAEKKPGDFINGTRADLDVPRCDDETGAHCEHLLDSAAEAMHARSHKDRRAALADCATHLEAACRSHAVANAKNK